MAETNPYPPYSGEDARCPKCGYAEVSTSYQPGGRFAGQAEGGGFIVIGFQGPEWLGRTCNRCDHSWPEACIDAYPATSISHG